MARVAGNEGDTVTWQHSHKCRRFLCPCGKAGRMTERTGKQAAVEERRTVEQRRDAKRAPTKKRTRLTATERAILRSLPVGQWWEEK
jgi:ribosomal protein L9